MNQQRLSPLCLGMQWEKEGPVRFRSFGLTYCDVQFPGNEKRRTCSLQNELEHRQNAFTATSVALEQITGIATLTSNLKYAGKACTGSNSSDIKCLRFERSQHAILSHFAQWLVHCNCLYQTGIFTRVAVVLWGLRALWLSKTAQHLW